jgi:N4-gp56 family major capsid protein
MALTNFGTLTGDQLQMWSRDFWRVARNQSFINQFAGSGSNAMVQRVTELTKNQKGTKANITLLADMTGDGITGDNTLEGNEEALRAFDISIELDQLRFANRIAGRMTDQKTVVNFREQSRDALAYAIADRCDQLAFLTLSGVAYTHKNNGALRTTSSTAGHELVDLEFASDVSAPTAARHLRVDVSGGTSTLAAGDTTAVAADDKVAYRDIVNLKAYAKDNYIRGIRGAGNQETFHMFVTPQQMADLKLDSDFLANVRNAGVRGGSNSLFAGSSSLMVDGVMIHEFRHVFNTVGATSGSSSNAGAAGYKWAQALTSTEHVLCSVVLKLLQWLTLGCLRWLKILSTMATSLVFL